MTEARSGTLAAPRVAAVVYNPGKVRMSALRAAVHTEERSGGWGPSTWHETGADDSGGAAARDALDRHPSVILVAGGDGTVRVVAETVYSSGIPLALIPVGTANLLARNMNMPLSDLRRSVHIAFTGINRRIDIARAELTHEDRTTSNHAFTVMAGIGLDANMAANTSSVMKKRIGWLAYTNPIAKSIIGNKQLHMHYTVDNSKRRTIRAHTVIVGNCGTITASILLMPDAVIDDGLLDVVVLRPSGAVGWARVASRLAFNGMLHGSRNGRRIMRLTSEMQALQYAQGKSLSVEFDVPEAIELDGDSFGAVTAARISVVHHALVMRVPA
jgi:diacylglycerol kinase (ATP)